MSSRRQKRRGGRGLFEVRPGQYRPKNVRNGAIFTALIVLFLIVIYVKPTVPGFGPKGQEVKALVSNGIDINPGNSPVRVKGVDVGTVTKRERGPGGRGVVVTFLVEKGKGVTVHKDATAAFRFRTALGRNVYVDLNPGSPSSPKLGKGETLPESQTEVQTAVDQALDPFDANGQKALKTIINEFDKGFGSASAYQKFTKELGPALRSLGPGLRSIRGTQAGDLQKAIQGTSRVFGSLARSEVNLGSLINNGNVALGVTAAKSASLQGIFSNAPGALQETRVTMARLRHTLDVLDPTIQDLRPGSRKLAGAADNASVLLRAAAPLLNDARPTVKALKPAVQDLTKLTTSGNNLMATSNPVFDDAIYPILPYLRTTDVNSKHKNYEMIGPALSAADGVVGFGDRHGTIANFEAGVGESSVPPISPCTTKILDPSASAQDKINCDTVARIITAAITGQNPDDVQLRDPAAPPSKVTDLLKSKTQVAAIAKKIETRLKQQKSTKEAGR